MSRYSPYLCFLIAAWHLVILLYTVIHLLILRHLGGFGFFIVTNIFFLLLLFFFWFISQDNSQEGFTGWKGTDIYMALGLYYWIMLRHCILKESTVFFHQPAVRGLRRAWEIYQWEQPFVPLSAWMCPRGIWDSLKTLYNISMRTLE